MSNDNIYLAAREKVRSEDGKKISQSKAAEMISQAASEQKIVINSNPPKIKEESEADRQAKKYYISGRTLGDYERNNDKIPSPALVKAMSEAYKDSELCREHCDKCCIIGKHDHVFSKPKSLTWSSLRLIDASKTLENLRSELFNMLEDGKIDEFEMEKIKNEIPSEIKKIKKILLELEMEIDKRKKLGIEFE